MTEPSPPSPDTRGLFRAVGPLLVGLIAVSAYLNGLHGELLYDDIAYIVQNPQVQDGTWADAFNQPLQGRSELGLYRPLPVWTYQVQAGGQGPDVSPVPMHAWNVALHVAASLLVLRLGRRFALPVGAALVGASWFAAHPVHVESVTWIVGRAELLAAVFGLSFLVVLLRTQHRAAGWVAAPLWVLACLSKEGALALPAIVLLDDLLDRSRRRSWRRWLERHGPWCVGLIALVAIRLRILGRFGPDSDPQMVPFGGASLSERVGIVLELAGSYLRHLALPWPNRVFYHESEFATPGVLAVIAVVVTAIGLFTLIKGWRTLTVLLGAIALTLGPVLNLVPIQETFAQRFLYTPSAFACLLVGWACGRWIQAERARRGTVSWSLLPPIVLVAGGLTLTWRANEHFDSALELWTHNVRVAPEFPFNHYQTAYFLQLNELAQARGPERKGAPFHYKRALELSAALQAEGYRGMPPDQQARALLNLGRLYFYGLPRHQRDVARAEQYLRQAEQLARTTAPLDWEWANALYELARLRHHQPDISSEQARAWLQHATTLDVDDDVRQAIQRELHRLDSETDDTH